MTYQTQNRKRVFFLSGISNYGAIIVSFFVVLISVPIGLHYFGPVKYGIWFVISSILAYLRMSDFGIGVSTLTLMAQATNPDQKRVILRRSIGLLLKISAVFIGIVLVVTYLFPGWIGILGKIPSNLQGEVTIATFAIVILTVFQLPVTIFSAAFSGLQQVYWNRIYASFHSISALGALLATVLVGGNLVTLAIFTGLGSILVGIISGIHLFLMHPQIRPRLTEHVSSAQSTKFLFTSGARFFCLQIASLIILNTDNLVISNFLGPEEVTPYAVTFKAFYMCLIIINGSIFALWPMYSQAAGKNDWNWIQRTYNVFSLPLLIGGGLVWIGGIIFFESIINLWAGPVAYGGLLMVFALGGYVYLSSFTGSNVSIVNGLNPTNIVVIFAIIEAIVNLGISIMLVGSLGIGGVALGTFIASLVVNTWFHPFYINYRTSKRVSLEIKPIVTHSLVVITCVIFALLTNLFLSTQWTQFAAGTIIIILYLVLSWWVIPINHRGLIKDTFSKLALVKGGSLIKNRM